MTSKVSITPVRTGADLKEFINLSWRIYRDDPHWIPPIKSELAKLLTPGKHPFWEFSQRELFLARRGNEVVARIAAIIDGNYNQQHQEKVGAWGFFESERNVETAQALFSAAENWCRQKGMNWFRGPLNPSVNYEIGLLIQGFDRPPTLGFTHNPFYYHELIRGCGLHKEKDVFAYMFSKDYQAPQWAIDLAEKISSKGEIRIRKAVRKNLVSEVRLVNQIYNECWAGNWGYVPMTEKEILNVAHELYYFLDTDLIFFLYIDQEPIGVSLVLPDINPLFKRFRGWGGLWALMMRYLFWSDVTGLRGYILGVKEKYRQMGVPMVAFHHLMQILARKDNYHYMELGWTLEDNDAINRLFEEGGATPSRRFRIYGKELG